MERSSGIWMPHLSISKTKGEKNQEPVCVVKNTLDSNALNSPLQSDIVNDPFLSRDVSGQIAKRSNQRGKTPNPHELEQHRGA